MTVYMPAIWWCIGGAALILLIVLVAAEVHRIMDGINKFYDKE